MKTIIFHAGNNTHREKFSQLILYLNNRGYKAILVDDETLSENVTIVDKILTEYIIRNLIALIRLLVKRENLNEPALAWLYMILIKMQERCIRCVFDPVDVRYVVSASDRAFGWEQALRYYCIQNKIRHVILPISRASGREEMRQTINFNINKFGVRRYSDHLRGIGISMRYHQVPINVHDLNYYYYPYWMLRALDKLKLLQSDPFLLGSSPNSTIFCASKEHKNKLIANGKVCGRVKLIGYLDSIISDNLQKHAVSNKYFNTQSRDEKALAILALPPLMEHDLCSEIGHWRVIVEVLVTVSRMKTLNWLVSLHPKMNREVYERVCKRYDLIIADERFYDLAQVADFAITYEGSTLVDVMEELRKPTIVCGWWGLDYTRQYNYPLILIRDKRELSSRVKEIFGVC